MKLLFFLLCIALSVFGNAKQYLLVTAKASPSNSRILNWKGYMLSDSHYTRAEDFQAFLTSDSMAYKRFKRSFQGELIKLCRLDTVAQRYETEGKTWRDIEFPEVVRQLCGEEFVYKKRKFNYFECLFCDKRCSVFWDRYDFYRDHLTPGYHGEYYFEHSLAEAQWIAIIRIDPEHYALLLLSRDLLPNPGRIG